MTDNSLVSRGNRPILVQEDLTFTSLLPSGAAINSSGFNPNGTASGAVLTITVTGTFGNTIDGAASGALKTVTASLIAGAAVEITPAPGATVTATTSISSSGVVHTAPIDGGLIYEFAVAQVASEVYQSVDYDSIYGRGDRIANGLLKAGQYGFTFVFSPGTDGFDDGYGGNGPAASGTTPGAAFWFATVQGELLDIRGFTLMGTEGPTVLGDLEQMWTFRGGLSPGNYSTDPYFATIEAFNPNQLTSFPGPPAEFQTYQSIYESDPRFFTAYAHYEIIYVSGPRAGVRIFNEMWLKIAHSNLDGGDRRPSVAPPSKRVAFTMSSDFAYRVDPTYDAPQESLFDGRWFHDGSKTKTQLSRAIDGNPVTTVGAWFQFVFPRPVKPKHLLIINFNNNKEVYSSGLPTKFGTWHWEYSVNGGASWASIGSPWFFRENCIHMIAPQGPDFALPVMADNGATHWRMVLDAGPAFGLGQAHWQIIFDLEDVTGLAPPLVVNFTDDTDATPAVATIGPPGSAYVSALSDGSSDGLTFTVLNTPNPLLSVAFTDEGQFDTWSDLYPSVVVQTVVVATGR